MRRFLLIFSLCVFPLQIVAAIKQDILGFNLRTCSPNARACIQILAETAQAGYLPSLFLLKNIRVRILGKDAFAESHDFSGNKAHLNFETRELIIEDRIRLNLITYEIESLIFKD